MNYNNLAQRTNWIAGSEKFELVQFYLTSVNIPGISFTLPEIGGRGGARLQLPADTATFSPLSFDMLIDEDFKIYKEFMNIVRKNVSVDNSTFTNDSFDFWIQLNNSKGNTLMKLEFHGCRLESIGDIDLNTTDDSLEQTLNVTIKYDYYELVSDSLSDFLEN